MSTPSTGLRVDRRRAGLLLLGLACALAGCGRKGPLRLPEDTGRVAARGGPRAAAAAGTPLDAGPTGSTP